MPTALEPTSAPAFTDPLAALDEDAFPRHRRSSALAGLKITFAGLLFLTVVLLVGLAALHSEANLLLMLFGFAVGLLGYNAITCARAVRNLDVERVITPAAIAGRPFTLVYAMRSRRRWGRHWGLVIGEATRDPQAAGFPRAFVRCLPAGRTERFELAGRCVQRGRVKLDKVRILSRFPFGLFVCSVDLTTPAELVVYPAVGRFHRDPWRNRRRTGASASRKRSAHRSPEECYGVREYREGDTLRWIHWRRTARTGVLVVREMMPLRVTQLNVLLDPWPASKTAPDGPADAPADGPIDASVERVISLAATCLCDGLERGYRVGLICRAASPIVIAPSAGRAHRQRLLHELALLAPGAPEELDELVTRIRWSTGWNARCVVCTPRLDDSHSRIVRFLHGRAEDILVFAPEIEGFDSLLVSASAEGGGR